MELENKLKKYVELSQTALSLEDASDILPAFLANVFKEHSTVTIQVINSELDQRILNLKEFLKLKKAA